MVYQLNKLSSQPPYHLNSRFDGSGENNNNNGNSSDDLGKNMDNVRAHVFIRGKVQGVYFRHNTKIEASRLGLSGWVRNLDDGRVEALFEGESNRVQKMVEWCNIGPPAAVVKDVELKYEKYNGEYTDFTIL